LRPNRPFCSPIAGRRPAILRHLGWSRTCPNVHGLRPGSRPHYPLRKAAFLDPVDPVRRRAAAGYLRLSAIEAGARMKNRSTAAPSPGAQNQKK
jgi:hypothetical protein